MRSWATIGAGIVAGLIVALGINRSGVLDSAPPRTDSSEVERELADQKARVAILEQRFRDLERQQPSALPRERPPSATEPAPDAPIDREQAAREVTQERLSAHAVEPREPRWAPEKEHAITNLFARDGGVGGSLVRVDCRTTTCVATLAWPTEQAARGELRDVMRLSVGTGCSSRIQLDPAEPGSSRYEASLLIDCAPPPMSPPRL